MRRILFLIPDLTFRGTSQLVRTLAAGLPRDRYQTAVCAVGPNGPVAEQLRAADVPCQAFGWRRWFDGNPYRQLRRRLREFQPDIIHAWGWASLRLAWLATLRSGAFRAPSLVTSASLPEARRGAGWAQLDTWLLRNVCQVVALGSAEVRSYLDLGVRPTRIAETAPGVLIADVPGPPSEQPVPEDARVVMCVGPVEPDKGFRTAIWAVDILRYLFADLHLVVVGEGSDVPHLQRFARSINVSEFVHFVGRVPQMWPWLHRAEVVWVPTRTNGGTFVALEALAAGRPVVAARRPALAEVVTDGVTGFLVPPNDPVALARQTRLLLQDERLRHEQGRAGRQRVHQSFTARHLVERLAEVYNSSAVEAPYSAVHPAA